MFVYTPNTTAICRPIAPMEVPTWATYSELKKEIEREHPNLTAAEHERHTRELCTALGL